MTRIGCALLLVLAACEVGPVGMNMNTATTKKAKAVIDPTPGNTVTGEANFSIMDDKVMLLVTVANAPPGVHGFHIHLNPACGNNGMDAGPHWDGGMSGGDPVTHGLPTATMHHAGDTGNVMVGADGTGSMMIHSSVWTIGDGGPVTDVVNHGVIFHTAEDVGTMASAGARIGCGIITEVTE